MGMMYYYTLAGALVIILIILLLLVRRQRQRGAGDGQSAAPKRKKKKSTASAKAAKAKRSAKKPTVQEPEAGVSVAAKPTIAAAQREDPRKSSMATRRPEEWSARRDSPVESHPLADWQDPDETRFHLDEDQVMRRSTYAAPGLASEYRGESRQAWLAARLSLQSVLGWFTVTPSGDALFSDQEYDPEVYLRFAKLLRQMIDSAQLVGMEDWKDFVVHGTEGVILMVAIRQSAMAQEDYLVVFLDEESSIKSVLARIRQDD